MLDIHFSTKEHYIVQNTLERYVDNFHPDEHNDMKPKCMTTSVGRPGVKKKNVSLKRKFFSCDLNSI